jgi:hypothetical protein
LLEILKKKQTTREIADALQKGGIESVSTNFIGIVHAVLSRARKTPNSSFVKLGAYWGLKDWYPKGIVSAAAAERPAKRKKKKTQKSSAKAGSTANSPTQKPQLVHNQPGLMARLGEYLKGSPGIQFTVEGLGEKYGMQTNAMAGILARLANKGAVEKLPDGKYRYPIEHSVAAVQ